MKTYKYHKETKEFLYSEDAFPDPLESSQQGKEVYLLPADSTFTVPPAPRTGYATCWHGESWEYLEDHRQKFDADGAVIAGSGTPFWLSGDTWQTPARYMTELGPLPEGALLKAPAKDIHTLRAEKMAEINGTYNAATSALVETYPQTELLSRNRRPGHGRKTALPRRPLWTCWPQAGRWTKRSLCAGSSPKPTPLRWPLDTLPGSVNGMKICSQQPVQQKKLRPSCRNTNCRRHDMLLKTIRHNWHQMLVAADQFLTTVLCSIFFPAERSYADETLSCRAVRWE